MAPAPSKHAPTGSTIDAARPWADEVLFHADVGPELHVQLAIKPLVALIGTCKAAGGAIAFKPAEARAALAKHGKMWLCEHAAREGDLWLLQWAHEQSCPWNADTCWAAAEGGHLGCLKWLHEHGCPWFGRTCLAAAYGGHLDCLKYLVCVLDVRGCEWNADSCAAAARNNGHHHVLAWLDAQGVLGAKRSRD